MSVRAKAAGAFTILLALIFPLLGPIGADADEFSTWPTVTQSSWPSERDKAVQHLLRFHGQGLKADGEFGEASLRHLNEFRGKKGIAVSDMLDDERTWAALTELTVKAGDSGEAVHALQLLLASSGRPVPDSGTFDTVTEDALKAMQTEWGLPVNGQAGPEAWRALFAGVSNGGGQGIVETSLTMDKSGKGTRVMVLSASPQAVELGPARLARLNEIVKAATPKELVAKEASLNAEGGVSLPFTMSFATPDEYRAKLEALTGSKDVVSMRLGDGPLSVGAYLDESVDSADLLKFFPSQLQAKGLMSSDDDPDALLSAEKFKVTVNGISEEGYGAVRLDKLTDNGFRDVQLTLKPSGAEWQAELRLSAEWDSDSKPIEDYVATAAKDWNTEAADNGWLLTTKVPRLEDLGARVQGVLGGTATFAVTSGPSEDLPNVMTMTVRAEVACSVCHHQSEEPAIMVEAPEGWEAGDGDGLGPFYRTVEPSRVSGTVDVAASSLRISVEFPSGDVSETRDAIEKALTPEGGTVEVSERDGVTTFAVGLSGSDLNDLGQKLVAFAPQSSLTQGDFQGSLWPSYRISGELVLDDVLATTQPAELIFRLPPLHSKRDGASTEGHGLVTFTAAGPNATSWVIIGILVAAVLGLCLVAWRFRRRIASAVSAGARTSAQMVQSQSAPIPHGPVQPSAQRVPGAFTEHDLR